MYMSFIKVEIGSQIVQKRVLVLALLQVLKEVMKMTDHIDAMLMNEQMNPQWFPNSSARCINLKVI